LRSGAARARSRASAPAPPGFARSAIDPNRVEYEKRVNRVVDHVERHLAEELSLTALSRVAAFSPFHFRRVFRAMTGFAFIQRLRLERSASALLAAGDRSVLEVALDHGFASAATFARAFRVHFGMSATEWCRGGAERWPERRRLHRKLGKQLRKPGNAVRRRALDTRPRRIKEGTMNIQSKSSRPVTWSTCETSDRTARTEFPSSGSDSTNGWRRAGLGVDTTVTLGVGPRRSGRDLLGKVPIRRMSGRSVRLPADRWVNVTDVPGGRYAVTEFIGTAHEIEAAWHRIFSEWLPTSGYQPDDRPCFELYRGDPAVDVKSRKFRCDLCLPVKAL
jgi:AraC family transcriptional regulator